MSGFEYGMKRAVIEIINGFVTSIVIDSFISSGLLPYSYVFLFGLLNVISIITLILTMPLWGLTYLLGWIFGVIMMLQSELIGIWEAILYLGAPIVVIALKIKLWLE
jgi:hypothetical protein